MELKEGWHLDKRVPVALIVTLIVYGIGFVWQLSTLRSDVDKNTENILTLKNIQASMQEQAVDQSVQLSRIEEQIRGLRRDLGRYIEREN